MTWEQPKVGSDMPVAPEGYRFRVSAYQEATLYLEKAYHHNTTEWKFIFPKKVVREHWDYINWRRTSVDSFSEEWMVKAAKEMLHELEAKRKLKEKADRINQMLHNKDDLR